MKFTDDYAKLVTSHGGHIAAQSAEGRYKALFIQKEFDDDVKELYEAIKAIFDPYGTMNPGVKQSGDVKTLVAQLRKSYELPHIAQYFPTN